MKKSTLKSFILPAFILISSVFLNSCNLLSYDLSELFYRNMSVEQRSKEILTLNDSIISNVKATDEYDILIITDLHYGCENQKKNGDRREEAWFKQINETDSSSGKKIIDSVKFAICMGDIADHGTEDEFIRYKNDVLDRLKATVTAAAPEGIRVYETVGNHDLYNSGWNLWCSYTYPGTSFYKFETPSFSWYFLDSASGTLGNYQIDSWRAAMEKDKKKKFIFTHIPIYADDFLYFKMQNTDERNKIISTCAKDNTLFFVDGHTHDEITSDLNKFTEYNIPGFLEKYGYAILHVNETDQTASLKCKYY